MKPAAETQLVDGTTAVVRSEIMRKLMAMVERVAQQDAAVLIVGETGSGKVAVNVRVIAATNRDLELEVHAGKFRRDLYHRLTQFQLQVPPLRDRLEDISALAEFFLRQHAPTAKFSDEAMQTLLHYLWPGNVR